MSRSTDSIEKNSGEAPDTSIPGNEAVGDEAGREPSKEFKKYIKYTLIFFGLMTVLYLFSMYGSMLASPGFTYAEF
ncbi:MAG: hypothetical protein PUB39_07485 [Eubacteriales bacterium]|nr:hypothetical protein [Eubacteriales bacterium]